MPVTTILQHMRDREKLNQPDLGTRVAEDDHNITNKDTIKRGEKAAAVAGRGVAPDSTHQSKMLNNPTTSSTRKGSSRGRKTKQTNSNRPMTSGKTTPPPRAIMPLDGQSPRQVPTVNCDSRPASCAMQQNTQPSRTSNEPQQNSPSEHPGDPPTPADSVYEVARRAVDFLDIHNTQDTEPQIIGPQLVVSTTDIGEQRTQERCNAIQTPPTSNDSAQTSPSSPSGENGPPIRWSNIQTYPSCRDAIVFSDRTREREMVSRQQRASTPRPPSQSYTPRPKSKSAAARRRAILKHSVTYSLPAANPQTPAAPEQAVVSHPTMTSNQVHPPRPEVVSHSASTLRQATPVHSVMALRPGPLSYPQLMPRPRWQPIYPKSTPSQQEVTASQPPVTSQQASSETNRERSRHLGREAQLRNESSLQHRESPLADDPSEPAIVGFAPSVGNRVVEHLVKHNPSAIAASKLSHTIPQEAAVHYNSVLTWQAQNAQATGDPSPHGHPTHSNEVESRAAPSNGEPASRESQALALIVVPIRSAPVSQQLVNTENYPHHSHSNTLAPQHGVQSHPYYRVPSGESGNAPNGSVSTQQSIYGQRERRVMDDCDNDDVQEISRQDWQAANKDRPRYRAGQRAQTVVASVPYERTMASSASSSSVNPQSIPEPWFEESGEMMLPLSPELPICQSPVSMSAQTRAQTVRRPSNQANPVYGDIHKRKSSRAGRPSPPQATASRIAISQLVHSSAEAPKTAVRRIAISQLVHSSTVPRIAISQLVNSETEAPKAVVPRVSISQLVHSSTEVPKTVVPQTAMPQSAVPQAMMPQATMPRTSPRTSLPSARPDRRRRVRLSRGGMWLSQDDIDRWQEERRNPYRLPTFNDSFRDVVMTDRQPGHEKPASSEPAGGRVSLDAYRINPVASGARNWHGMVNN
ncbi:hypothetical protein J3F84DRAFT_403191 [Trichoderma pleuroticola]